MINNKVMDSRGCALLETSVIEMDLCRPHNKSHHLTTPKESLKARLITHLY